MITNPHLRPDRETACATPVDLAIIGDPVLRDLLAQLAKRHHLDGTWVHGETPVLMFRLPPGLVKETDTECPAFKMAAVACRGMLGRFLCVQAVFTETGDVAQVAIPATSPVVERLRRGAFRAVFVRHLTPIAAAQLRWPCLGLHDGTWKRFTRGEAVIEDLPAAYYEMIGCVPWCREHLTPADRLSIGWAQSFGARVVDLQRTLDGLRREHPLRLPEEGALAPSAKAWVELMLEADYRLSPLLEWLSREVGQDGRSLHELLLAAYLLSEIDGGEQLTVALRQHSMAARELCETYACSSAMTHFGHRIGWIDTMAQTVRYLELSARGFPEGFAPEDYWRRQIWDLPYELGRVLSASDVPVAPAEVVACASQFPMADNVQQVHQLADDLLDEASASKAWTIPPGAIIECRLGPFAYMELTEIGGNVFVVFRTAKGETYTAAVMPFTCGCTFAFPITSDAVDWEQKRAIQAGVRLILCAIVRDFWVLEKRERAFAHRLASDLPFGKREPAAAPRVVYLPRVRYEERPKLQRASRHLQYRQRRAHAVSAHLRRSFHASECQLILARRHGFEVPDGYTFVRPHQRGNGERERGVIYRSRSVLELLFPTRRVPEDVGRMPRWFRFEKDVRDLMEVLGFSVEHVAESRQGGQGIEVYATSEAKGEHVHWIILCLCLHPKRRVGPTAVRRLEASLDDYPPGTRGMIVTTGRFSSTASQQAEATGIRLVDGEEFTRLANRPRPVHDTERGGPDRDSTRECINTSASIQQL